MSDNILRAKINSRIGPITIPAGSTVTVDTMVFANYRKANYQIELYNVAETENLSLKMDTVKNKLEADYSIYAILGSGILKQINFSVIGSDVVFAVTNDEAFDLIFQAAKST